MTIDECILDCIHYTSTDLCKYERINWNRSQIEQIAEWLEELKALKNGLNIKCDKLNEALEKGKKIGYNKAIDDFAILMKETLNHDWATTKISEQIIYNRLFDKCSKIAEQLKVGGKNETD